MQVYPLADIDTKINGLIHQPKISISDSMRLIPNFIYQRIEHRHNLLKIINNIGWLFFDKILRMGVGVLVGVWIARYLGPEQFGLLSFATAFVGLFGAVATLGLQGIVVRNILQNSSGKEEILGSAACLQLFAGAVTYIMILIGIFILRPDDLISKMIVAIIGAMMLFKFSEIAIYWFEAQVMSKYIVWVQNISFLLFSVIKGALIFKNAPLSAFAWAILAEAMMVALLMLAALSWRGLKLIELKVTRKKSYELLKDSWPLMLSSMAIMIYMKIDQIMIGQMIGDQAVGIYTAATRISEVLYFLPTTLVASVFPSILNVKMKSETLYKKHMQRLYDLMVWISIAIALPMTFLATPLITLLFGSAYSEAGMVLAIHIWASIFVFLGVASNQWYLMMNRQTLIMQRTLIGAIVNVGLNLLLIPIYGVVGAAIATVISYAIAVFFYDAIQKETRGIFFMKLSSMNLVSALKRCL
ncbi:flippase [Polynucleobacter rarus]|uniref:flippase n=1 Tax=Polynucleobacter rarus TaxID=556055 RepID=UPI001B882384|nr:flippase [Polynucleobacter rarus]